MISHELTDFDLTSTDHKKIKGTPLKDPSVAASVPVSIENAALAHDPTNDEFYIRSKATSRPVYVDLRTIFGQALTARDWSPDFAKLQSLPSDPAKESGKLTNIDTTLTAIKDTAGVKKIADPLPAGTNLLGKIEVSDYPKALAPASVSATASGATVVKTPATGKKLRVRVATVHNSGTADIAVDLRFTSGGTAHFKKTLAAKSGWGLNLLGAYWEGAVNEGFYVNLGAAGSVDVTILSEEI